MIHLAGSTLELPSVLDSAGFGLSLLALAILFHITIVHIYRNRRGDK